MGVHLDEPSLLKELSNQGFQVDKTKDGYKVLSQSVEGRHAFFHASTLDKSPRAYQNVLTQLRKIGFVEPETWHKQRLEEGKAERKRREQAERDAGPYLCTDCGDESKEYPFKRNLARHQQAARHGEYADVPILAPTAKPKVKRDPDELKAKRLIHKLKGLIAQINETADELFALVEPMEKSNTEMRGKLKRLERVVGNLVEEI